jgi:hypothetical protein
MHYFKTAKRLRKLFLDSAKVHCEDAAKRVDDEEIVFSLQWAIFQLWIAENV